MFWHGTDGINNHFLKIGLTVISEYAFILFNLLKKHLSSSDAYITKGQCLLENEGYFDAIQLQMGGLCM